MRQNRQASVSFHPQIAEEEAGDLHLPVNNRTRSVSLVISPNRYRSESLGSMESGDIANLNNIISQESKQHPKSKIKLEDVDLEKQIIITAGGRKEVTCFILKLILLMALVTGSAVLIFFAL